LQTVQFSQITIALNRLLNAVLKKPSDSAASQSWEQWFWPSGGSGPGSGERICIQLPRNPNNRDIEKALGQGNPVLVKVLLSSGAPHWVLLVGRDQKECLAIIPLR